MLLLAGAVDDVCIHTCNNKEPHVRIHLSLLMISSVVVGAGVVPESRLAITSAFSSQEGFANHMHVIHTTEIMQTITVYLSMNLRLYVLHLC